MDSLMGSTRYNDRDLIESVISSYFIVDYGFVKKVNDDGTIDVVHACRLVTMDGDELPETETKRLEVLTFSTNEIAVSFKPKEGDKVLLLALKNYVANTEDVIKAETPTSFIHYERETMKALPLAAFDSEAKIKIEADDGALKVAADTIELNGNSKSFVTYSELDSALQQFVNMLNTHTHNCASPGSPSGTPLPQMTIDISASETGTIKTGG